MQAEDRPPEDVLEALARDDPTHHRAHQRLGAFGFGAAAGDQPGGEGIGQVVLDVRRGEGRPARFRNSPESRSWVRT